MEKDQQLLDIYVESREATDDLVESKLMGNIQAGDQRAIEFYLTNRRSTKWRVPRLLQEQDGGESLDIQEIYANAIARRGDATGDSGEDVGLPGFDQDAREVDRKLLERPQ